MRQRSGFKPLAVRSRVVAMNPQLPYEEAALLKGTSKSRRISIVPVPGLGLPVACADSLAFRLA